MTFIVSPLCTRRALLTVATACLLGAGSITGAVVSARSGAYAASASSPSSSSSAASDDFGAATPVILEPVAVDEGFPAQFDLHLERAGVSNAAKVTVWLPGYTDEIQAANGGWTAVNTLATDPASGVPGTQIVFTPVGDEHDTTLHFGVTRVPAGPIWALTAVFDTGNDRIVYADGTVEADQPDFPALQVRVDKGDTPPSTAGISLSIAEPTSNDSGGGSNGFGIVLAIAAVLGVIGFTWAIRKDLADRKAGRA